LIKAGHTPGSFAHLTLNGVTACVGMIDVCKVKPGHNVVISSAAGATGLMAL